MPDSPFQTVLRHLRRAALRFDAGELTDRQLLERFLTAREEAAFEVLLRRHGPMVLGVCRRVLNNAHDAEDAFQATFLVFVRKAGSIIRKETVGGWLYGVACRTAQKARSAASCRRTKEQAMSKPEAMPEDAWQDLRPLLDLELNGLPLKYREPLVLCDLKGNTRCQAAKVLGCPEGTVAGRLARGRVLLAKRLARHGLVLSGGTLAMLVLSHGASAGVPAALAGSTIQAAALVAAGHATAGVVAAPVAFLVEGVLKTMFVTKAKLATAVLAAVGLVGLGFGVYGTSAAEPPPNVRDETKPALVPGGPAIGIGISEGPGGGGKGAGFAEDKNNTKIDESKPDLPSTQPPVQVLASLDKEGKLVIKTAQVTFFKAVPLPAGAAPFPALPPGAAGGGAGAAPAIVIGKVETSVVTQVQTFDLEDIQVLDAKGKKVDKKDLAKLLKKEVVALASLYGEEVDPLHLRVVKKDFLVFVLPQPKLEIGLPGFGIAPPPIALPPGGFGGAGPGGFGGAVPAVPATPILPAPKKEKEPKKP